MNSSLCVCVYVVFELTFVRFCCRISKMAACRLVSLRQNISVIFLATGSNIITFNETPD